MCYTKTGKNFERGGGGQFFWLARIYTPVKNKIDNKHLYFDMYLYSVY